MKRVLFTLMIMAFLTCPVMAARYRGHQVAIVDEFGDAVTDITSISIFDIGTTTATTIYSDRAGDITVTNPITTTSANSTFVQALGQVRWFQAKPTYKITVTDGTKSLSIDSQAEGDTRFPWYANYIGTLTSLSVGDNNDLVFGTDSDVVATWENANNILSWIPDADGVSFDIGDTDAAKQFDFNVYVGGIAGGGLTINEGTGAFTYVSASGAIAFDATGSGAFGVHTGAATGAITLGSGTSGAIALDTTAGITVNADDSYALTVSAGTIGIASTGGDLTIDATDKSVIIRGTEEAADAILLDADGTAGGIELQCGTGDITLDSGDDIFLEADTGSGDVISIINTQGTAAGAVILRAVAGNIDMDALGAATLDFSAATDATGGFKVTANVPTGQQLYGAIYGLAHIEGTTDGVVSALRGRIDMDSSSAPTSQVHGARINVQEVGADLSGTTVVGLFVETLLDAGGNDPAAHYMMRFNTSEGAEVPTAWIMASNPSSIAYTANTTHTSASTDKVGAIKIHVGGATGIIYLYCYSHVGQ